MCELPNCLIWQFTDHGLDGKIPSRAMHQFVTRYGCMLLCGWLPVGPATGRCAPLAHLLRVPRGSWLQVARGGFGGLPNDVPCALSVWLGMLLVQPVRKGWPGGTGKE